MNCFSCAIHQQDARRLTIEGISCDQSKTFSFRDLQLHLGTVSPAMSPGFPCFPPGGEGRRGVVRGGGEGSHFVSKCCPHRPCVLPENSSSGNRPDGGWEIMPTVLTSKMIRENSLLIVRCFPPGGGRDYYYYFTSSNRYTHGEESAVNCVQ